ncbi:MAG TPA: hypothetical protein VGZ02_13785 [Candidatus Baltobacteraceae bacterium]|jgi:hypothetical protein|nr:hypothetical protein [Candidatus Baltobacteraceae bacterium]
MRSLLSLLLIAAIAYGALTAYAGFRVARGIDEAKASSVVTRAGAHVMGRDAVERLAIRKGNVPTWITQSPAFWLTLRALE